MLSRQSLPDSIHSHSSPITYRPTMGFDNLSPTDPSAVDFRAFYPYTPNEVKHRKRTTSAQLKVLETVFKRDTKPNATLRNELASELEMTARGVQVWFQNRRAKEKTKSTKPAGKPASPASALSSTATQKSDAASEEDSPSPLLNADRGRFADPDTKPGQQHESLDPSDASSDSSSPPLTSPPQLHLITDATSPAWQNSPVEPPPNSATYLSHSHSSLFTHTDVYSHRRGSLPVNVLPQADASLQRPSSVDWFDPLTRRRSVDASLQRLASNPYAHLARAKNGALFGARFGVAPPGRHHQLSRVSYSNHPTRTALTHYSSVPHVNIRRSSMDSRASRLSVRTPLSPPPSVASPYHTVRASLPDHRLYGATARTIVSPIPGPLPSPNFSFGAASTPSMTSPSSADSERNSPDSLRSFSYGRGEEHEDDGGISPTYDAYSRFGSIVSIATSESSLNSSYYPDIGGPRMDHVVATDMHSNGRRDSCSAGQFLGLMSDLESNVQYGLAENNNGIAVGGYPPHEEYGITRATGIVEVSDPGNNSYPSPASTISPGNSPHGLDGSVPGVPISRTSELAFALHSKEEQPGLLNRQDQYLAFSENSSPTSAQGEHATSDVTSASNDSISSTALYQSENEISTQAHYATYSSLVDAYTSDGHSNLPINAALYSSYGDSLNPSSLSPIDSSLQSTDSFAPYS